VSGGDTQTNVDRRRRGVNLPAPTDQLTLDAIDMMRRNDIASYSVEADWEQWPDDEHPEMSPYDMMGHYELPEYDVEEVIPLIFFSHA
jgi:hypothetical protein